MRYTKLGGKDLVLQSNLFGNTVLRDSMFCRGGKDLIMLCNRHGNTPLHEACRNSIGNENVIKLLIDNAGHELLEGKTKFSYLNKNKRSKLTRI